MGIDAPDGRELLKRFRKVLVVDDSAVFRELISTLLQPYCEDVVTEASAPEAIECLEGQKDDLDLVICDVVMGSEDGFIVLEYVHRLLQPKPQIVLVTAYGNPSDRERARQLGAAGYLPKPTTMRQILAAVEPDDHGRCCRSKPRWRCVGTASLFDPDSRTAAAIAWDVYNISPRGAFLETKGPLPAGSEFHLAMELDGRKFQVRARVVRVQEPNWMDVGGVGVEFVDLGGAAEAELLEAIEAANQISR
jgi:CheY-like chemotaxis protein